MKKITAIAIVTSISALVGSTPFLAHAASENEAQSKVSFELKGGLEYDSNVNATEIDSVTNKGDGAAIIEADFQWDKPLTKATTLTLDYSFSQNSYFENSDFNLQTHLATASLSYKYSGIDFGTDVRFIKAGLGGDDFLTMSQISPSASFKIGQKSLVRLSYTNADKQFASIPMRDARNDAVSLDVHHFIDNADKMVSLSVKSAREKAQDTQYSYDGNSLKLRYSTAVSLGETKTRLSSSWKYETRDYKGVTPSLGRSREDKRSLFEVSAKFPVSQSLNIEASLEHGIFDSNLASAKYDQDVISLSLSKRF